MSTILRASNGLWVLIIGFAAIGLACGGELALITLGGDVTIQAIWTGTEAFLLSFVCVFSIKIKKLKPLVSFISILGLALLVFTFIQFLIMDVPLSSLSYLVSAACFGLAWALSRSGYSVSSNLHALYIASLIVCTVGPIFMMLGLAGDNRVLQMTIAFAVIFTLLHLEVNKTKPSRFYLSYGVFLWGSFWVFIDGARSASLLIVVTSFIYLVTGERGPKMFRRLFALSEIFLGIVIIGALTFSGQWSGGDQGVSLGSHQFNTNGRVTLAQDVLANFRGKSVWQDWPSILLGNGVGTSADESIESLGQSAPLNEFIRCFVDLGFVGVICWFLVIVTLGISMLRLCRGRRFRPLGALGAVLVFGLLLFSLTENMISYSWVLIPIGVVLGFIQRSGCVNQVEKGSDLCGKPMELDTTKAQ